MEKGAIHPICIPHLRKSVRPVAHLGARREPVCPTGLRLPAGPPGRDPDPSVRKHFSFRKGFARIEGIIFVIMDLAPRRGARASACGCWDPTWLRRPPRRGEQALRLAADVWAV